MSVRLYVGNLPYDVTEAELRELFSVAGSPSMLRIPTDRETGRPRGFAFVEFAERREAEEAIRQLNQQLFKGRPLAINEARPKEDRAGPPPMRPSHGFADFPVPMEPGKERREPKRSFGPDAPRGGKKFDKSRSKQERAPKIVKEKSARGSRFEEEDDQDDFARWSREDANSDTE
ncbi:MAG: hypothetical protein HY900_00945 [Deltaproteobacteria bacterium]|nr:hypothetical protein [Deltaproteobacteria bacterium]